MIKPLSGLLLSVFITSFPLKIEYKAEEREPLKVLKSIWNEEELVEYVKNQAIINGVNPNIAVGVMKCETPWKPDKEAKNRYYDINDSQSRLTYNEGQIKRNPSWGKVNEREKSYGPWQYHLPAHPELTIEEASSVEISTDKAMQDLKTNPKKWTCYK